MGSQFRTVSPTHRSKNLNYKTFGESISGSYLFPWFFALISGWCLKELSKLQASANPRGPECSLLYSRVQNGDHDDYMPRRGNSSSFSSSPSLLRIQSLPESHSPKPKLSTHLPILIITYALRARARGACNLKYFTCKKKSRWRSGHRGSEAIVDNSSTTPHGSPIIHWYGAWREAGYTCILSFASRSGF